jgi:hypothetical protein
VLKFLISGYQSLKGHSESNNGKFEDFQTLWCSGEKLSTKSENIKINAQGTNKDGTSGPNPPVGYLFSSPKFEGFKAGGNYEKYRNEYGEPKSNAEYENFKYVKPEVSIILDLNLNDNQPGTPKEKPELPDNIVAPNQEYWATLRYIDWAWIKRKKTGGGGGRTNTDNSLRTGTTFECPGAFK